MKTIFKSLLMVAFFVGIGSYANAQTGATSNTSVTARILKQITLFPDTIQFGTVAAGGGQTYLDPRAQSSSSNVGFNSRPGRLLVNATPEEPIRVEYDATVTMYLFPTPSDSITYEPEISAIHGDQAINDVNRLASVYTNNTAMVTGDTIVTNAGGNGRGGVAIITTETGSEEATLFLGGRIYVVNTTNPIPISGPTGTFRGTLNFNVFYAN